MRRIAVSLLVLCAVVFGSWSANAQMGMTGVGEGGFGGSSTYDAATVAWAAASLANGCAVTSTLKAKVNTFIVGMKAQSTSVLSGTLWSNADLIEIPGLYGDCGTGTGAALTSLPNPTTFLGVNHGATFTAGSGVAGDGSSTYVDIDYNPATQAIKLSQNSNGVGIFYTTTAQGIKMGSSSGTAYLNMQPNVGGNSFVAGLGDANSEVWNTLATGASFWAASRTGSGSTSSNFNASQNGSALNFVSGGASVGLPSYSMWICALNFGGSFNGGGTNPIGLVIVGAGYSAADWSNINTLVQNLAAAVPF